MIINGKDVYGVQLHKHLESEENKMFFEVQMGTHELSYMPNDRVRRADLCRPKDDSNPVPRIKTNNGLKANKEDIKAYLYESGELLEIPTWLLMDATINELRVYTVCCFIAIRYTINEIDYNVLQHLTGLNKKDFYTSLLKLQETIVTSKICNYPLVISKYSNEQLKTIIEEA
jgi:hypothetical protein